MTDEIYFNIKINVKGDSVSINKQHNLGETLPHLPPAAGAYIATLILAIEKVIEDDRKLYEVIELLCSPEETERVKKALEAVQMLMLLEEAQEKAEEQSKDNGNGQPE